jgi:PAS domain S-box-containing protein
VLITDTQGAIEYVNQRFTDVTGYTAGEVLGLTPRVLRSGRTAPEVYQRLWSTITSGAEWRGELENRKKSGELYWDDASISPIRNSSGTITHFLAVQQDVTARKHAETEIRRLNERLEQRVLERTSQLAAVNTKLRRHRRELQEYIDAMSTMNAKIDVEGRLLLVNRIAQQASGLPLETLLGSSFLDGAWWAFDPDVRTRVRSAFWQAVAGTPVSYDEQLFVFDKVATINLTLVPVNGADGDVAYIVAEGRDISRRIEVEEALKAANHELEAFTYSVSHDLRAPIRQIDGFSRLLEDDLEGMLDETARRYLSRVREGTQRMGRLVDDLLRLAQVGRQDIRPRTTSLATLLSEVLADLQGDLVGRRVQWKLGHLPTVDCDPGLMKVVLTNLVANAVKYTRPRHPAVIEIGHDSPNGRQVFFVRDNGVGFDTKYADRLFGAFQRLHRAEEFEGTGIGLATVQRIVHKHGGEIWAEAEPDKGATFYFTLGSALGTATGAR